MRSFLRVLLPVAVVSFFIVTAMHPPESKRGLELFSHFVSAWLLLTVILGFIAVFLMSLTLNSAAVVKEFDRGVQRLWKAGSGARKRSSIVPLRILPDKAFEGFYGQDDAVRTVAETIIAARQGLQPHPDGPFASFFFLGPTGVGKTELAYRVAAFVQRPLVKFDMGDFVDRHAAFRFTGAPPGYIGSDQPGQLAQAVDTHGSSLVLLFDEITLAHPKIWDTLMGLLDKGAFQDGSTGQWYNLQQHAIIILTSNALEDRATELHQMSERAIRDLLATPHGWRGLVGQDFPFRQAFIGRIGRIVSFRPLSPEAIRAIIKDRLNGSLIGVKERSGIELSYGDEVIEEFVATMREARYGVREIDSLIYEKLSPALTEAAKAKHGQERSGRLVVVNETLTVL